MSDQGTEHFFLIGYKSVGCRHLFTHTHTHMSKFDFVRVSKCMFMRVHKMVKCI